MKKIILICFLSLFCTNLQSQWVKDSIPTTKWLYYIDYFNSSTVYLAGGYGTVFKSTNGGMNWTSQLTSTQQEMGAVYFIDQNMGIAISGDYQPYSGTIFRTTNGGTNWVSKYSDSRMCFRHALHFINASTGYAGGWKLGFDSAIFKTTNGGENWQPVIIKGLWGVDKFHFVDANTGWAVGYGVDTNLVMKTTNGGTNWNRIYYEAGPISPDFLSVYFVNSNTGWIVGMHPPGVSRIMKTTNGGTSWVEQTHNHPTNWELYDVQMLNENTGWIVGDAGVIVKTTNGGTNWVKQDNPAFGGALFAVNFNGPDTGLAVGLGGRMIKTLNGGGPISVSNIATEIPASFSLSQNYPNPFNPTTKIRYAVPRSAFVELVIYDALGRNIETLVNEKQNAGTYEATFDASKYTSGVYFYRLTADGFSETKKMVLLK